MIKDLFDLKHTIANDLFLNCKYGYEILKDIKTYTIELGKNLNKEEYLEIKENIWIHKTAKVSELSTIISPCIIDSDTEIRPGAFIRGSAIIGKNCVIGNSSELKNVIIFDNAQIPHYNYVGDSIIGYHAHLGAGVITSNLKNDKSNIIIKDKEKIETGLRKMGSLVGDYVEIGCNSVLCPGTIIKKNTSIYPLTMVRGVIPENSIVKDKNTIIRKEIKNG